jgi:membrane-associated phospholipid phosphatase
MLKRNSIFLTLSLILVVVLGLALLYIPKDQLHLLLCDRHSPARDLFYRYYTTLAEWLPYVVCVALLLFGRIGDGIFASSAMLLSTLVTQVSKHIVNAPRPLTWFTEHFPDVQLPLVEGVRMNLWYSFPSGHTTSFFAMALAVCILLTSSPRIPRTPRILVQILLFFLAALGAYSRIYLSQHFAADVFAGVLVGVASTLVAYAVFYRYQGEKWYNYCLFTKK